jgi:drug/metabolite transporter (DMT)-like permease
MSNYIALGIFAAVLATGQVFFKYAAAAFKNKSVTEGLFTLAQTPTFYVAVTLYAAATLLWVWILSRVPLSQAYPWVALATSTVPVLAVFLFNERFDSSYWIGVGLVVLGVFLTQRASIGA